MASQLGDDASGRAAANPEVAGLAPIATVLDAVPSAVLLVDDEGRIVHANHHAHELFAASARELVGRSVEDLVMPSAREQHAMLRRGGPDAPARRKMAAGRFLEARRLDGTVFPATIGLDRLDLGRGAVTLASVVDATDFVAQQRLLADRTRALERSNRDLEQYAFVASHEIQEPLRSIRAFGGRLRDECEGDLTPQARQWLRYIVDGGERLSALVQDLLAYSRSRTRPVVRSELDAAELLSEVERSLQVLVGDSGAVITAGPLPRVVADRRQLQQLLQNLLVNAIRYRADAPPRIHVACETDDAGWTFSVQDNGVGIEPRHFDRIFAPFKRLHRASEVEGSGIGLALCRNIVERHGGRLWVESSPGAGSTFHAFFPRAEVTAPPVEGTNDGARSD
ncbi:MAG: PAS domain S-box protein [Ectothiorhodospiraceae bacterium]|nr:PAS domain S-box protein [Ectothiorhodospiraceae bacterium]